MSKTRLLTLVVLMLLFIPLNAQKSDGEEINECTLAVPADMVKVVGDCDEELRPHGHWVLSHRREKIRTEGEYVHGRKVGIWRRDLDGVLFSETIYSDTTTNYMVRAYWHDGLSPKSEITFDANGKWLIQTNWDVHGRRSSYPNPR